MDPIVLVVAITAGTAVAIYAIRTVAQMIGRVAESRRVQDGDFQTDQLQKQIDQLQTSLDVLSIELERQGELQRFSSQLTLQQTLRTNATPSDAQRSPLADSSGRTITPH